MIGFSRGAAAARHFVARHAGLPSGLPGPWLGQGRPELVMNFVGLFETVSSFEEGNLAANGVKKLTKGIFHNDVSQLTLAIGALPKRVVHLTALDEFRDNFSLTTIDSSLRAGVGFEMALPGVHSDIGGGYVEPDPANPTLDPNQPIRELNQENRRLTGFAEKQQLVADGWYTDGTNGMPNQFMPLDYAAYARHLTLENHQAARAQAEGRPYQRRPYAGAEYGTRYLTNEYQYVVLYLMLGLAQKALGTGNHEPLAFKALTGENAKYQVPADLQALRDQLADYVADKAGSTVSETTKNFPVLYEAEASPSPTLK